MTKRLIIIIFTILSGLLSYSQKNAALTQKVKQDQRLDSIQARALRLLTGFSAGTSYSEVWIRDLNTFIRGSLKVHPKEKVKQILLMFFKAQGDDGNIVDGLVDSAKATGGYKYRYSALLPGWAGHKNTVETDQESSLIQAVYKYVEQTGDQSILTEMVGRKSVYARMEEAVSYILKDRWEEKYQLVKGATTIDWGDVQPEAGWGVAINEKTKWSVDIYDNAMFVIALKNLVSLKPRGYESKVDLTALAIKIKTAARKYLWDNSAKKYRPHLYPGASPFTNATQEDKKIYTGGTICAIMADINTPGEIRQILTSFRSIVSKEKYATIGMTVYPPYSKTDFPNMPPYQYQNAGDWTWFGGRIAEALAPYNMLSEAYELLNPMFQRTYDNNGFYEWYHVQTGKGSGSGDFRGEAGVLYDAIEVLRK
ncbi:MAG: hypothetical protein EOO02_09670 [Chitinophagaceae bacterium]|nr:MAG: hypothetical protein EOO02_09670 [Chitinophagaceae bacterium]